MAEAVLVSPNCLDLKIPGVELEARKFPDGESYVRIPIPVEGKSVALVHKCYPNQDEGLIQLFIIVSQLRDMKAKKITCVVPYLPYARQDKRVKDGEAVSAETICRLLKECGCSELVVLDCHFLKKEGEFSYSGLKIRNLSMSKELIAKAKTELQNPKTQDLVITSPDVGASYMSGGKKMDKKRGDYNSSKKGEAVYRDIVELNAGFEARGKNVVIIDDMISTGNTMVKAVETLKKAGASKIVCCATHGLFLNSSLDKLVNAGASVFVSDSIQSSVSSVSVAGKLRAEGIL
ncbi:ribose-phosphate pyrophosphokinase [Candidatus Micrarchaeota archaeon]|nr:ribose-phosphate pyrophosphokinase [Candidatus Micrarchaeota archaeon]